MKSASNRRNYRYNPCKRRQVSFNENSKNNRSTLNPSSGEGCTSLEEDFENNSASLPRETTLDTTSTSIINAPLNFDSTLKVCIEKINTDLIFNTPGVCDVMSVKHVTQPVTGSTYDVTHLHNTSVTQSSDDGMMDVDMNISLLYDTIPRSTPAQKAARRAKRKLQLEQWRLYDLSRTRSERYLNRLKKKHDSTSFSAPSSRKTTIKWKKDLVQTFLIEYDGNTSLMSHLA